MSSKVEYLEWEPPTKGESWEDMAPYVVWKSKCGRYRVGRIDGVTPRFQSIAKVDYPGAKEITIQNDMKLLSVALISVEKYHKKQTGVDEVVTRNYKTIMREAEENGLDTKPANRWVDTTALERLKALKASKKSEVLKLTEDEARKLLVSVGYGKARKEFNRTQLKDKLNRLDAVEHTLKEPRKQENKNLLEDCLQVLAKGQKIMLKSVKPTNVRPLICDPEHYPEDAQYVGGRTNETKTETKDVTIIEQHPDGKETEGDTTASPANVQEKSKGYGCLDAAAKVLAESGKDMSCKEMIEAMEFKGYWVSTAKTPNITLNSAINTELKVGYKSGPSRFSKVGYGQYGLNQREYKV